MKERGRREERKREMGRGDGEGREGEKDGDVKGNNSSKRYKEQERALW